MKQSRKTVQLIFAAAVCALFLGTCLAGEYVHLQILDPLDSNEGWIVGGSNHGPETKLELVSHPSQDGLALALDYEFTGQAVGLNYCEYRKTIPLPLGMSKISLWVWSDSSGHSLRIRVKDSSGQYLQYNLGLLNWYGWRQVTADLAQPAIYWGGAEDGIVHWPASFGSIVIDTKARSFVGTGRIYVDMLAVGNIYPPRSLKDSFDSGPDSWRGPGSVVLSTSSDRIEGTGALSVEYSSLSPGQMIELEPAEPFPIAGFPIRASLFAKGKLKNTQLIFKDGKGQELVLDMGPAAASQYSQLSVDWSRDVETTVVMPLFLAGIRLYPGDSAGKILLDSLNSQTITWQAADATGTAGQRFNLHFAFESEFALENFTAEATAYQNGTPVSTGRRTVSGREISGTVSLGPLPSGVYELVWSGVEGGFRFSLPPMRLVVVNQKRRVAGKPFFGLQTHYAQFKGRLPDNLDLVVQAGGQIIRDEVYWGRVEKQKGVFEFPKEYDDYIAAAAARNLEILIILDYGNSLYGSGAPVTDDQLAAWAEYVRQVVSRYKDQVNYWEIWNEFSHGGGLSEQQKAWSLEEKAAAYFKILQVSYPIIKELDPDSTVIGFANAGIDLPFIQAVFALGGDVYMDAVSVHPYRHPRPPETSNLLEDLIAVKEFIGDKALWCTEMGWPTHRAGVDEETQAAYLARTYIMLLGTGFIDSVIWYDLQNDGTDPEEREHNFGLIDYYFNPKPGYWAYNVVADVLLGATVTPQKQGEDGLWLYSFTTPEGDRGYALWSAAGVKAINLPEQGTWLCYHISGEMQTLSSTKGGLSVVATANPVFLLPKAAEEPSQGKLLVAPNPLRAGEVLTIAYLDEPCRRLTATLYNLAGAQVASVQAQAGNVEISTGGLRRGAYLLQITVETEGGTCSTQRRLVLIL